MLRHFFAYLFVDYVTKKHKARIFATVVYNRNDYSLDRKDVCMKKQTMIYIDDVSFRYGEEDVLQRVSFEVKEGEFWALIGPNGSGKSTLIRLILGLTEPTSGEVKLFGVPATKFKERERIGYVSQKSNAFNSSFPATVLEVVRSGLTKEKGLFRRFSKEATERSLDALKKVDMQDFAHRNIGDLSGGQQQRVFIARALVGGPELLIMDEPTVGIDERHVRAFYELLERLNEEHGLAILLVTHEIDLVTSLASHVACLNRKMHFHGDAAAYNNLDDATYSEWYGHPVRRVHDMDEGGHTHA